MGKRARCVGTTTRKLVLREGFGEVGEQGVSGRFQAGAVQNGDTKNGISSAQGLINTKRPATAIRGAEKKDRT